MDWKEEIACSPKRSPYDCIRLILKTSAERRSSLCHGIFFFAEGIFPKKIGKEKHYLGHEANVILGAIIIFRKYPIIDFEAFLRICHDSLVGNGCNTIQQP